MGDDQAYRYTGQTLLIERYRVLGERACSADEYDLFDLRLDGEARDKLAEVEREGPAGFREMDAGLFAKGPDSRKLFLYAPVFSRTKTEALLCVRCPQYGKLWVNGTCVCVHILHDRQTRYLTVPLRKGRNDLLLELYAPGPEPAFSIQLRNSRFERGADFRALSHLKSIVCDPLILVNEPPCVFEGDTFRFLFMTHRDTVLPEYRIDIVDTVKGFVRSMEGRLNRPVTVDAAELRDLSEEPLRNQWIKCTFRDTAGRTIVAGPRIFTRPFRCASDALVRELREYGRDAAPEVSVQIEGRIRRLRYFQQLGDFVNEYWTNSRMKELLDRLKAGTHEYEAYTRPGLHEFFIHSDLDDSAVRLMAKIPDAYDGSRAFPAVIALPIGRDGGFCKRPPVPGVDEHSLLFDVTGRGFTGGAYTGEASVLELLGWICRHYRVDRDRIYLLGSSNGGYTAWALAQNYPHLAAAVYPHVGYPDVANLRNVSNLPIYQTVSPQDFVFAGRCGEVKNRLKAYGRYHQFDFRQMLHGHMLPYLEHPEVLCRMFGHKRDPYPRQVLYRTVHNRHLESFWIRLHGITAGRAAADIRAEVESPGRLSIRLRGSDGVTVTIPPQIDRTSFVVRINGQELPFGEEAGARLILRRDRGRWAVGKREPRIDYRKGTGLLDVYLHAMRILVPDGASDRLLQAARRFSEPQTNGLEPQVDVRYPVYRWPEAPEHLLAYHLILFDSPDSRLGDAPWLNRLRDRLPIQCGPSGFTYQGTVHAGDYMVMQAVANPQDARRSVLVVSASREELFSRNLLTRKVTLPYYTNGPHPYWNNMALVFQGGRYTGAWEWGMELREITGT